MDGATVYLSYLEITRNCIIGLDGGFNLFAARDEGWIFICYRHKHPCISFKAIAYTLMDEDLAHLSPATVYLILKETIS